MQAIDTRWFADTLAAKRLSQRGLGRLLGCNASSVNRLINGKRPLRFEEAERLATFLGVEVADIITRAGVSMDGAGKTYLVGYIDGDRQAHIDWDAREEFVETPIGLPPTAVAVQYRTAMTELESFDGWTIYVDPPTARVDVALNRLALITMDNGITIMGFLRRGYKPGKYNIITANASARSDMRGFDDVGIAWATPVLLVKP